MRSADTDRTEPLWRDEFAIRADHERYVNRRQFAKFLVLTSLAVLAGNVWILIRSWLRRTPTFPVQVVARANEVAIGGVKLFGYPTPQERCILIRTGPETYAAYSQKCTHLSCAVYYSQRANRLECPCHEGYFSVENGSVLQGPPPRPLPRVKLERRGDELVAVGMDVHSEG